MTNYKLINKISKKSPDLNKLFLESTQKLTTITFCNPLCFKVLKEDADYLEHLEGIDFVFSDGMLLCSYIEKITKEKCERVSFDGNSIGTKVFDLCNFYDKRVALVGTQDKYINEAVRKLNKKINIVYHRNGYFSSNDEIEDFFESLKLHNVQVLILGMGAPHQERILNLLRKSDFEGLAFTCGGYLEQLARKGVFYYPEFFNKHNLRWLYRILDEPGKILKRYIFDYAYFYSVYFKVLIS